AVPVLVLDAPDLSIQLLAVRIHSAVVIEIDFARSACQLAVAVLEFSIVQFAVLSAYQLVVLIYLAADLTYLAADQICHFYQAVLVFVLIYPVQTVRYYSAACSGSN